MYILYAHVYLVLGNWFKVDGIILHKIGQIKT